MHEKRIAKVYLRELSGAVALYTTLLAAAITFLDTAGFPKLSMFTVWCVLCLSVLVVQIVRKINGR